jgi:hypothetical protein
MNVAAKTTLAGWKSIAMVREAEIRRLSIAMGVQADEIERLRGALQDARQALVNIASESDLSLAQTTARVALGVIKVQMRPIPPTA